MQSGDEEEFRAKRLSRATIWLVTTKDGTKYEFAHPAQVTGGNVVGELRVKPPAGSAENLDSWQRPTTLVSVLLANVVQVGTAEFSGGTTAAFVLGSFVVGLGLICAHSTPL